MNLSQNDGWNESPEGLFQSSVAWSLPVRKNVPKALSGVAFAIAAHESLVNFTGY
ncbi:MAG TPA: hypothetical protein VNZ52_05560 [Candidatus Thermoplasmatota archaeon]|nr:hypothetical protein [Candidatus Thermoplasmatota archaeon]